MRVAVVGGGSIGIILAALVTKNIGPIDIIESFQENVDALNKHGATVTGFLELNVPVKAYTPDMVTGTYDIVFLCNKQTTNSEVLQNLLPHLNADSLVLTLQNGIPEDSVAKIVGKERTAGGAVGFGATWLQPGISQLTSTMYALENFAFDIGELSGEITPRIKEAQRILSGVGTTIVLNNLMGFRWSKVLMNATFSGMSAALGSTFGDVLYDPIAIKCIAHIADETIKVSKAAGVKMEEMQGKDFTQLELNSKDDVASKIPFYHEVWGQHEKLKASMLQDLEKGRKTEIDYINGYVAQAGHELGIPTPFNDKVVELVKREEETGIIHTMRDIKEFMSIL